MQHCQTSEVEVFLMADGTHFCSANASPTVARSDDELQKPSEMFNLKFGSLRDNRP